MLQVITSNKSCSVKDTRSVDITGNNITFNISLDGLSINNLDGQLLKAPVKGNMIRYIKENLNVRTYVIHLYL